MSPDHSSRHSRRAGRPPASSPLVLEEAAAQLYLEQGYAATTVAQITARAGVARSSFFNYFQAKADVLWSGFDAAIDSLAAGCRAERVVSVADEIEVWANLIPAENVALLFTQSEPMRLSAEDVRVATGVRITRLATVLHQHCGLAEVVAYAYAAALLTALAGWSRAGAEPGRLGGFFRAEVDRLTAALA